ncbi:dUTP diphosphatase [Hafnia alvei]|nr:dUTP diphosphatase [Hafnia alvei]MBI0275426.1 dUTP diphosphatase [Hafnia alvei]PNK98580.1 dUTP diphosphatase [Hafnia alvei]
MQVKVKKLHHDAIIPKYASEGAAAFDLHAITTADCKQETLIGGTTVVVGTGLAFEIPEGHVMLVTGRSGHGFNHGVRLSNCLGVIDSDYRGEVKVRLRMDDESCMNICNGDRVAQAMILPVVHAELVEGEELSETLRGVAGFGSTGTGVKVSVLH